VVAVFGDEERYVAGGSEMKLSAPPRGVRARPPAPYRRPSPPPAGAYPVQEVRGLRKWANSQKVLVRLDVQRAPWPT
jgi:hypothetical protein